MDNAHPHEMIDAQTSQRLTTPVLFLVFNRPETTKRVFEAIRSARPPRLYVGADGVRSGTTGEAEKCAEARRIATAVDWPCDVHTLFRDENLGCRKAVSQAIDWFFEQEAEGIILEDDCLPDPSFFRYAKELLNRYRDDERIMCISAQHFHGDAHQPEHSYFFSRYNHCWGWASWRRAWQHYDHDLLNWPQLRNTDWLLSIGDGSRLFQRYWTHIFDRCHAGKIDSWAYRWTFSCWAQHGLATLPAKNLVTNIGFGDGATHTASTRSHFANLPLERLPVPLTHPYCVVRDVSADSWTDTTQYKLLQTVILIKIKQFIPFAEKLASCMKKARQVK